METNSLVRLQKALADAGVASRRACEELITDGRVSVNGEQITQLGTKVNPEKDELAVDGEIINANKSKSYLIFNKPAGVLSTMSDPEGRPSLGDYFKERSERLFHVGRLDKESEGLIVLTNDGEIAHRATHPSYGLVKKYIVDIEGRHAVAMFGSVVEQLAESDAGHGILQNCSSYRRVGLTIPEVPRRPATSCPQAIRGMRRQPWKYR